MTSLMVLLVGVYCIARFGRFGRFGVWRYRIRRFLEPVLYVAGGFLLLSFFPQLQTLLRTVLIVVVTGYVIWRLFR